MKYVLMILMLLISSTALALKKEPKPKLCNTLFFADVVVRAKVMKHEEIFHAEDPQGAPDDKYYLNVIKTFRGEPVKKLVVISEMGSSNVNLKVGKEYILFPLMREDGTGEIYDSQGEAGRAMPYSQKMDRKIQKLLRVKTASIEGEVRTEKWDYVAGILLTISGNGIRRTITTNKKGKFFIRLAPGTYEVDAAVDFEVIYYSFDGMSADPHNLKVTPQKLIAGQCSQIQLHLRN